MKPSTGADVRLHRNAVRDRPESLSAFKWNACPPSPEYPVRDAIARGAIGFDAVKHLVLCRIERRPPRLDMTIYPYLPKAHVAMTAAKTYLGLMTGTAS